MHYCRKSFISMIKCPDIIRMAMKGILLEILKGKQNEIWKWSSGIHHFVLFFCFIFKAAHKIQMLSVNYVFAVVTCGYVLGSHLQAFYLSDFSVSFTQVGCRCASKLLSFYVIYLTLITFHSSFI